LSFQFKRNREGAEKALSTKVIAALFPKIAFFFSPYSCAQSLSKPLIEQKAAEAIVYYRDPAKRLANYLMFKKIIHP
jgi:hypothetical protein